MIARLLPNGQLVRLTNRRLARHRSPKTARKTTSQYRGVYWEPDKQRWRAAIQVDDRVYRLGRFRTEEDAAVAYDRKAIEIFGAQARVNVLQ